MSLTHQSHDRVHYMEVSKGAATCRGEAEEGVVKAAEGVAGGKLEGGEVGDCQQADRDEAGQDKDNPTQTSGSLEVRITFKGSHVSL